MPDFIEPLRRRLVELGCPMTQVRRLVQEIADHREDLKQAALSEGLSEANAESRADAKLGDPLALAEQLMATLRQSSWWGRHSVIGFCVVPLLAVPVLWALLLFLGLSLAFVLGFGWDSKKLHTATGNPVVFQHLVTVVQCADLVAIALVSLLFCWLARRTVVSFKWMLTACAICSLYALFSDAFIQPNSFVLGLSWTPHWIRAALPLVIAGAIYAFRRRTTQRFLEKVAG
ncbi:MAG: hypothetical protein ABSD57_12155 [Verrucomicrobiota bacterium]|jgi:hypothetical protein